VETSFFYFFSVAHIDPHKTLMRLCMIPLNRQVMVVRALFYLTMVYFFLW